MPFNVRCRGCDATIARGVRFNAEKKTIGKYHSIPIHSFKMLTSCCAHALEIHTDPKASEYVVVEGADRMVGGAGAATRYGDDARPGLDLDGTIEVELQTREERDALAADPFAMLERGAATGGEQRAKAAAPSIRALHATSDDRWGDHYAVNKALRRAMRGQRKEIAANEAEAKRLGLPEGMTLLPNTEEDQTLAREAFRGKDSEGMDVFDRNRAKSRSAIARSSIFSAPGAAKKSTAFTSVGVSKVSKRANAAAAAGAFAGIFSGGGGVGGGAAAAAARREGAKASSADGRAKRLAARRSESSKGGGAVFQRRR